MKKTKAIEQVLPCLVLRDDREKVETDRWEFPPTEFCAGTKQCRLTTGDYTLEGFESFISIERKASVYDFVTSMSKGRFKEELDRLTEIAHGFVILEFEMDDLYRWPASHTSNQYVLNKLPLRHPGAALASYLQLKLTYPHIDFIFAGPTLGKKIAGSIFKRIVEAYAKRVTERTI